MMLSLALFLLLAETLVAQEADSCSRPLGMEDGRIGDSQITASGWLNMNGNPSTAYRPHEARLNFNRGSKGWCSSAMTSERTQESRLFLQIDLLKNTRVTGLALQNGPANLMKNYKVMFQRADDTFFRDYALNWKPEIFAAGGLPDRVSTMILPVPIIGRVIRIIPLLEPTMQYCCLRLELYGCDWARQKVFESTRQLLIMPVMQDKGQLKFCEAFEFKYPEVRKQIIDGLVSYVAPAGSKYGDLPTQDSSYDGAHLTMINKLTGGLGRLTDGAIGKVLNAPMSSYLWVGYRGVVPVITFKFSGRRFFNHLVVHSMNAGNSVAVFGKLEVLVVGSGRKDFPLVAVTSTDLQRRTSGSVAMQVDILHYGDELQMQFFLLKEWLLISEIEVFTENPESPDETDLIGGVVPGTINPELFPTDRDYSDDSKNSVLDHRKGNGKKAVSFPIIIAAALGGCLIAVAVVVYTVIVLRRRRKSRQPKAPAKPPHPCLSQQSVLLPSTPSYSASPSSDVQSLLWTSHMAGIRPVDRSGQGSF